MAMVEWETLGMWLLFRAPYLIVGVVGLWLAIRRRSRHPRASLFAGLGFAGILGSEALSVLTQALIHIAIAEGRGREIPQIAGSLNLPGMLLYMLSLTSLALAVFSDRRPATAQVRADTKKGSGV